MMQFNTYAAVDADLCKGGENLLDFLVEAQGRFALFGHQGDDEIRRVESAPSDVFEATGTFPAVFGFDLGGIEHSDRDAAVWQRLKLVKTSIRKAYGRGGIVTLSWHSVNPVTGLGYGSNLAPGSVRSVLPGGDRHTEFLLWLDHVADFVGDLKSGDGELIPVIFRPFHEHNGDWFWWGIGGSPSPLERSTHTDAYDNHRGGAADSSPYEFAELWRSTVHYLKDVRDVHNLLYAISPDRSKISLNPGRFEQEYLRGYPGDDMVDIFGLDDYIDIGREDNPGTPEQVFHGFVQSLQELVSVARQHGKIAAMTEVGTPNDMAGAGERPWTGFLDRAANTDVLTRNVLWYLTWTNSWNDEPNIYGTPISGDPTGSDFKAMKEHGFIRFLDRMPAVYHAARSDT